MSNTCCPIHRVYPRACGGTGIGHVRQRLGHGFIPAPAGEPLIAGRLSGVLTVYPRACGGTFHHHFAQGHIKGLSPRLRGNPYTTMMMTDIHRFIPAPAGEPRSPSNVTGLNPVYPRACGGTFLSFRRSTHGIGLSPRLRGNRRQVCHHYPSHRFIPAPAGEPRRDNADGRPERVYPRACGGTCTTR